MLILYANSQPNTIVIFQLQQDSKTILSLLSDVSNSLGGPNNAGELNRLELKELFQYSKLQTFFKH